MIERKNAGQDLNAFRSDEHIQPAQSCLESQVSDARESFIQYSFRTFKDLWSFRYAITAMVANNLRSRYRRSILGFLWSLLNPLLSMVIITCVFAMIWGCDIREFAPHIFSGLLPWTLIATSLERGSQSLVSYEGLLRKIYAPKAMFPLVVIGTEAVNFFFCVIAFYIIGIFLGFTPSLAILMLPVVLGITCIMCLGLTLMLSVATVYFRDLSHIISISLSAGFYLLPILYPISMIPEPYRGFIYFNPFYHFIVLYRNILKDGILPSSSDFVLISLLTVGTLFLGLAFLNAKEKNIIFRL